MTSEMEEDDRVMQVREGLHCGAGDGGKPNNPSGTCPVLFDTSVVSNTTKKEHNNFN